MLVLEQKQDSGSSAPFLCLLLLVACVPLNSLAHSPLPRGLAGSLRSAGAGLAVSDKTLKSARLVFKISPPGLVFIFLAY